MALARRESRPSPAGAALLLSALLAGLSGCFLTPRAVPLQARTGADAGRRSAVVTAAWHLASERPGAAIRELQALLRRHPDDTAAHRLLAESYRAGGHLPLAFWHYRRALALEPALHAARLGLAELLLETGRQREALSEAARVAADPDFAEPWRAWTLLGRARLQGGEPERARAALDRALALEPGFAPARLAHAVLERAGERPLRALDWLRGALDVATSPALRAEAHGRAAEILASLGELGAARSHLERAAAESDGGRAGPWSERARAHRVLLAEPLLEAPETLSDSAPGSATDRR